MSKLEFTNITVTYDEEKVNKKLCKKYNLYMKLFEVLIVLLMVVSFILGFLFVQNTVFLLIIIGLIFPSIFGLMYLGYWVIYHNTIKSFFFVEWLFKIKDIYTGWFNNKILIRTQYPCGYQDYSLQGFVSHIHNKLEITDKSDGYKPIHIYIDVTDDEKTEILIENTEENNE